jgi:hypothetical protein
MCVWDGTYTAPEAEREAMDQIPGWNDDAPLTAERRHAGLRQRARDRRRLSHRPAVLIGRVSAARRESSPPALRMAS